MLARARSCRFSRTISRGQWPDATSTRVQCLTALLLSIKGRAARMALTSLWDWICAITGARRTGGQFC